MATWSVVGQKYGEKYMPNGTFQKVVTVSVQADDGAYADIDIPQAQYTTDNVKAQIEDWYEKHVAVRGLSGS